MLDLLSVTAYRSGESGDHHHFHFSWSLLSLSYSFLVAFRCFFFSRILLIYQLLLLLNRIMSAY